VIDLSLLAQVLSVFITIGIVYFSFITKQQERIRAVEEISKNNCKRLDKMESIDRRLAMMESKYELFWKVIEPHLEKIIHSPAHQERDYLVSKFVNEHLTICELERLATLMEEALEENHDLSKSIAFSLLLARTRVEILAREEKDK